VESEVTFQATDTHVRLPDPIELVASRLMSSHALIRDELDICAVGFIGLLGGITTVVCAEEKVYEAQFWP